MWNLISKEIKTIQYTYENVMKNKKESRMRIKARYIDLRRHFFSLKLNKYDLLVKYLQKRANISNFICGMCGMCN